MAKLPTHVAFKPHQFTIIKDRRKGLNITSPDFDWSLLSESETRLQWIHCKNALWEAEKEGKITFADLEPDFYQYLANEAYDKEDIKAIKKVDPDKIGFSLLSTIYLFTHAGAVNSESREYAATRIALLIEQGKLILEKKAEVQADKPKKSIQESMKEQLSDILGELQGFEDELKPDVLRWLKDKNVPKVHIKAITEYYAPRLAELEGLEFTSDAQYKEGYSKYKKKQIKDMVTWYKNLLEALDSYNRVKTATRKVRARKPVPASKLVKNLKTVSEHLGIKAIKAESIIGASTLWLFNTKTRKLVVYNASDAEKELGVKGTCILGWEPKTSFGKTLRNPEKQLTEFMQGGKVAMRNFHKNIKGVESKLNGRVNKDWILLKVYV